MEILEVLKETVKETLESGDPTVRSWALVNNYYVPFVSSAIYVLFVKSLGPAIMRNRKPFNLRFLMIVYNFFLVCAYGLCLLTFAYLFFTTEAYTKLCSPTVVTEANWVYVAGSTAWYLYILKYIEFADTIFFVLRKKNHLITNLHVIHHASLPVIVWILFRSETSGFQFIPGTINSFIHLIMYTYYGLAAFGPEVQKYLWWKEYLTQLQILQFVLILFFALVVIPLLGCTTSRHGVYMDLIFGVLFLALFINFYTKTYKKKTLRSNKHHSSKGLANGHGVVSNGKSHKNGHSSAHNEKSVLSNGVSSRINDEECKNYVEQITELVVPNEIRKR